MPTDPTRLAAAFIKAQDPLTHTQIADLELVAERIYATTAPTHATDVDQHLIAARRAFDAAQAFIAYQSALRVLRPIAYTQRPAPTPPKTPPRRPPHKNPAKR